MSYIPPVGTSADASFQGAGAYTPPSSTSVDANWLQTTNVPLLTNTSTLHEPVVDVVVAVPLVTNANVLYEPLVQQLATVSFTFQGQSEYTPAAPSNVQFQFGSTSPTLSLPLLANTSTLYDPSISVGSLTLEAPLLTNTSTLYDPVILLDSQVAAPLLTNVNTLYAPTVTSITSVPLLVNTSTLMSPYIPTIQIRVTDANRSPAARSYRAYIRSSGSILQQGTSNGTTGMLQIVSDPSIELDIQIIGQGTEPDVFMRKVLPA